MASRDVKYTVDGNWQFTLQAFKVDAIVYKTIGAGITARHKEMSGPFWHRSIGWVERPVDTLSVSTNYEGVIPSAGALNKGNILHDGSNCEHRLWAAGIGVSLDGSRESGLPNLGSITPTGPTATLDVQRVRATARVQVRGEAVQLGEVSAPF